MKERRKEEKHTPRSKSGFEIPRLQKFKLWFHFRTMAAPPRVGFAGPAEEGTAPEKGQAGHAWQDDKSDRPLWFRNVQSRSDVTERLSGAFFCWAWMFVMLILFSVYGLGNLSAADSDTIDMMADWDRTDSAISSHHGSFFSVILETHTAAMLATLNGVPATLELTEEQRPSPVHAVWAWEFWGGSSTVYSLSGKANLPAPAFSTSLAGAGAPRVEVACRGKTKYVPWFSRQTNWRTEEIRVSRLSGIDIYVYISPLSSPIFEDFGAVELDAVVPVYSESWNGTLDDSHNSFSAGSATLDVQVRDAAAAVSFEFPAQTSPNYFWGGLAFLIGALVLAITLACVAWSAYVNYRMNHNLPPPFIASRRAFRGW
jgi:hypothetical protein